MSANKETKKEELVTKGAEVDRGLDIPTKPVSATVNALTTADKAVKREVNPPEPEIKAATVEDLKAAEAKAEAKSEYKPQAPAKAAHK